MAKRSRTLRNPLAGNGLIASRARAALKRTATEFGEVVSSDQVSVTVRTADGTPLRLSYALGNYIFSRVYNLEITVRIPDTIRAGLSLSFKNRSAPQLVVKKSVDRGLEDLNQAVESHLAAVDLLATRTGGSAGSRAVTLTPMGGAFVWVLIPPIFKATAFPPGEPEQILDLVRALRTYTPRAIAA